MKMKNTKFSSVEEILKAFKEGQLTQDNIRKYSTQKTHLSLQRRTIYRIALNLIKIEHLQAENVTLLNTIEEKNE